ncbi:MULTISPECIES: hypothetical protein [unclassified Paenibacillus]|uniref:hypothetical protein n=1 Tax=unclassified Paenibacillus TaxID=185978 RepID=UPI002405D56A|nr:MULTISPECIES: hypothetical protein [unclassified Paenibacillus]MDF9839862.1 hypothetical protein [Paenibacillus sp. PastF-2]MDF9846443.1 hypothetical protein [Paenibacillus sp. PastM-2]MDF9853208.1 hypothetical protein [Paenibacillus sp. PastF-1]MDH6478288.1 hypothetical protein [Paenibacillus sp. PastH-2]MDH6506213.1 hypothetical protein [Paenibacillus sp. PastM-3]
MNKPDQQEWIRYVQGEMTGPEREQMDRLLLEDPEALLSYMTALEHSTVPQLPDGEAFAGQIMDRVIPYPSAAEPTTRQAGGRLYKILGNQWVHYIAAACITMLFISAGVFDRIAPGNLDAGAGIKQPYSEKMVQKATRWLENIKPALHKP